MWWDFWEPQFYLQQALTSFLRIKPGYLFIVSLDCYQNPLHSLRASFFLKLPSEQSFQLFLSGYLEVPKLSNDAFSSWLLLSFSPDAQVCIKVLQLSLQLWVAVKEHHHCHPRRPLDDMSHKVYTFSFRSKRNRNSSEELVYQLLLHQVGSQPLSFA